MRIFDGHLHTFRFNLPVREGIGLFKRQFERFNVEKMSFLALPCDVIPGKLEFDKTDLSDNMKAMYYKSVFAPDGYAYAGLIYKNIDIKDKQCLSDELLRQVKEYHKVGYDGIKMYEGHPNHRKLLGYTLYDEVFDKFYDYCEEQGIHIIMHLANPAEFWDVKNVSDYWKERGCVFDSSYPSFEDFHNEILRRLEKNPGLKLSLAHFGFLTYNKQAMEKFMSFKNTILDICPGGENYFNILADKKYWKPFIEKYFDRITYGTDTYDFEYNDEENWRKLTGYRPLLAQNFLTKSQNEHFKYYDKDYTGLGIDTDIQQKILFDNLYGLLGKPEPVDYDYFINKCEGLYENSKQGTMYRYNLFCMKNDFKSMKNHTFVYDKY